MARAPRHQNLLLLFAIASVLLYGCNANSTAVNSANERTYYKLASSDTISFKKIQKDEGCTYPSIINKQLYYIDSRQEIIHEVSFDGSNQTLNSGKELFQHLGIQDVITFNAITENSFMVIANASKVEDYHSDSTIALFNIKSDKATHFNDDFGILPHSNNDLEAHTKEDLLGPDSFPNKVGHYLNGNIAVNPNNKQVSLQVKKLGAKLGSYRFIEDRPNGVRALTIDLETGDYQLIRFQHPMKTELGGVYSSPHDQYSSAYIDTHTIAFSFACSDSLILYDLNTKEVSYHYAGSVLADRLALPFNNSKDDNINRFKMDMTQFYYLNFEYDTERKTGFRMYMKPKTIGKGFSHGIVKVDSNLNVVGEAILPDHLNNQLILYDHNFYALHNSANRGDSLIRFERIELEKQFDSEQSFRNYVRKLEGMTSPTEEFFQPLSKSFFEETLEELIFINIDYTCPVCVEDLFTLYNRKCKEGHKDFKIIGFSESRRSIESQVYSNHPCLNNLFVQKDELVSHPQLDNLTVPLRLRKTQDGKIVVSDFSSQMITKELKALKNER